MHIPLPPIDAVITWVDGHCPRHRQKLQHYLHTHQLVRPETAAPTRFNQYGEITYSIRSLLHFAPWIRTIYVVTDAQTPDILNELADTALKDRVQLIDHRVIFSGFEHCLPTFNSLSIETMLWRIPGLSERFIYLNDDCFLIKPTAPQDFFNGSRLIARGEWKTQSHAKWMTRMSHYAGLSPKKVDMHRFMQESAARQNGWTRRFFHLPHAPFALHKHLFETMSEEPGCAYFANATYPFRTMEQHWVISRAIHLALKTDSAHIDNRLQSVTVNPACHAPEKIRRRLHDAANHPSTAFLCVQSLDLGSEHLRADIIEWLEERIPMPVLKKTESRKEGKKEAALCMEAAL